MNVNRLARVAVYLAALFISSYALAVQGVSSVGLSSTSLNVGDSLNITANLTQPGKTVSGTLVILVQQVGGSTDTISHSLSGTCPSSVTKSYTATAAGTYNVSAYIGGVYWPNNPPTGAPTSFDSTPCPTKTFTVASPATGPTTTSMGNLVPEGWADLVEGNASVTEAVGTTVGEISVGASGEANYSIPLWVTPGTSGMQPELTLSYSSSAGNGMLGQGWSLSGLSAITRGPQTVLHDGNAKGVTYASTDRFYLDGQRLIGVYGTYGNSGSEYRTEIDSFSRIRSNGYRGSGPQWFEVKTKSGLTMEYGSPTANDGTTRDAWGRSEALSWHLGKVTDVSGNYMTYQYVEDMANGVHYVDRINYTGNSAAGLVPYASVRFEYETRPDTSLGYLKGVKLAQTKRLKTIKVCYGEMVVRSYTLNYITSGPSNRSMMYTLWETGMDGKRYKSLGFTYDTSGSGWADAPSGFLPPTSAEISKGTKLRGVGLMDVNGDGYADYVQGLSDLSHTGATTVWVPAGTSSNAGGTWLNTPSGWSYNASYRLPKPMSYGSGSYEGRDRGARFVDVNGDGLVDYLYGCRADTGGVTWAYINTGSGWSYQSQWNLPTFIRGNYSQDAGSAERNFVDVNGDGRMDFVYNNDWHDGAYERGAYINTGSGWSYQSQWIPPLISNWDNHSIFIDVNGDGLPDQLQNQSSPAREKVAINTGNGFQLLTSGADFTKYKAPQRLSHDGDTLSVFGVEALDVNGDGLTDLIYYDNWVDSGISQAWLNTGDGWVRDDIYKAPYQIGNNGSTLGVAFIDVNGDGLPDQLKNDNGSLAFAYNDGTGFSTSSSTYSAPFKLDNASGASYEPSGSLFGDLDGDGMVDQLCYKKNSSGTALTRGAKLNQWRSSGRLIGVVNAFGVGVDINYAPLTLRDGSGNFLVYTKGLPGSQSVDQANVAGPMHVVESLDHEDGVGGTYSIEYSYGGLRSHRLRGSLGFATLSAFDTRTSMRTMTTSRQDWPYIGMPSETRTERLEGGSWRLLAKASPVTYTSLFLNYTSYNGSSAPSATVTPTPSIAANAKMTVMPYASVSYQYSYDPGSASPTSPAALSITKTTTGSFDAYGNPQFVEVDTTGPDGRINRKATTSSYGNDAVNWRLGRLSESSVLVTYYDTIAATNKTSTRTSSFGYSSANGLLTSETIEPDWAGMGSIDSHGLYQRTDYVYDAFGNVRTKTISGNSVSSRSATTQYDSKGRFPSYADNALGHRTTFAYNPYFGVIDSSTDPNGYATSWVYDGFGRATRENRHDGTASETRRRWAGFAAPSGAVYLVETETGGAPPAVQFYDKYGRETYAYGINGGENGVARIVGSFKGYDNQGRAAYGYKPFLIGATPVLSSETLYDNFGRVSQVKIKDAAASGGWATTTYAYSGLTSMSTNPLGQRTDTTADYQGRKVKVVSNATAAAAVDKGRVEYDYDGYGQITRVRVYNEAGSFAATTFTYDDRGRKIGMSDPDMGAWSYKFNAYGELISQTDAKSQTTTMAYDALGRMTSKTDGEGTITWLYDSSPWDTRKGFLYAVTEPVISRADGSGNTFQRRYIRNMEYDSYGRPWRTTEFQDWPAQNTLYYSTIQDYDSFGRPSDISYPDGFTVRNVYTAYGFLQKTVAIGGFSGKSGEVPSGYVFWEAKRHSIWGGVEKVQFGNGAVDERIFDADTGRLKDIDVGPGGGSSIVNLAYAYDALGNVTVRNDYVNVDYQSYTYDGLNRLKSGGGGSYTYDALGNIKTKTGVAGTYQYGSLSSQPHAVQAAGGSQYAYDANGNQYLKYHTVGTYDVSDLAVDYTPSNKVWRLSRYASGSLAQKSLFWFNEAGQRIAQMDSVRGTTHYIGSHYEVVYDGYNAGGGMRQKCYIMAPTGRAAVRVVNVTGPDANTVQVRYMHQDALGSVYAVTKENGTVEQRMKYDAWGKQTITYDATSNARPKDIVDRGFGDHEMLTDYGLVHMNGRLYDYTTGRFLSADPFIDDATDSQSYNRYSYVNNNPLKYSDPSGYFKFSDALKIVAVAVVAVFTAGAALAALGVANGVLAGAGMVLGVGSTTMAVGAAAAGISTMTAAVVAGAAGGFAAGFSGSLLNGGSIGAAFKAGIVGGISGALTAGIGMNLGGGKFGSAKWFGHKLAHGAVGGAVSSASGGEFSHGFLSSFAAKVMTPALEGAMGVSDLEGLSKVAATTTIAALVGGTSSSIAGGKFENGATTSAIQHLFNQVMTGAAGNAKPTATKGKYKDDDPTTLDELKKSVGWKKGNTSVFSMERKMGGALGLIAPIENPALAGMNLNTIHEQMFMIDARGNLSNFGFFSTNGGEIRAETFAIDLSKKSWELAGPVYSFSGDQSAYVQDVGFKQLDQLYTGNYGFIRQNCQDYCAAFRSKIE